MKLQWEHASVGIDNHSVLPSRESLKEALSNRPFEEVFVEQYIEGREFNISVLDGAKKPQILPPAEIKFVDFPPNVPRIIGYSAKWEMDSFEYTHTQRSFDFSDDDEPILKQLMDLSLMCWNLFNLKGYARVDFRVDLQGRPWILEINTNPCIAPDSGFVAAAENSGISYDSLIDRIIKTVI
jgi:D-alanine-D-alanine ligase